MFFDRTKPAPSDVPEPPTSRLPHPYVAARREWDERYGSLAKQRDRWMLGCAALAVLLVISPLITVRVLQEGSVRPYVALVDRTTGEPIASAVAAATDITDPIMMKHALWEFVSSLRLVSTDQQFQRQAIDTAYAYLADGSAASQSITDWYRANNPFERAATSTVTPELLVILPQTADTWAIEWTETERAAQGGGVIATHHYKAIATIARAPAGGPEHITSNPLQIFVTQFNFDRVQ